MSVLVAATSILFPGTEVPLTVTVAVAVVPVTAELFAGAVTVSEVCPCWWATYRLKVPACCSRILPAARSRIRRTYWAADQVSGEAEPAAAPLWNPIDAVVGSEPYGEAARSGPSQSCSGMRPTPDAPPLIACSRVRADPTEPVAISYSPRSPASAGHRWPVPWPVGAQGRPSLARSP